MCSFVLYDDLPFFKCHGSISYGNLFFITKYFMNNMGHNYLFVAYLIINNWFMRQHVFIKI